MNYDDQKAHNDKVDSNWQFIIDQRDAALTRAEKAEAQARAMHSVAVQYLIENDHFYDCIPGQQGELPDDERCSIVCIALRKALATTTPTDRESQ